MKSTVNESSKLTLLEEMKGETSLFQVFQYDKLQGGKTPGTALLLNQMTEADIKLKQVRIKLDNSTAILEAGALDYLHGNIEIISDVNGISSLGKKMFSAAVTGESVVKPKYSGTGYIYLEPTFGHYVLIELEEEEIIVDDGLFEACEGTVEVSYSMQKNVSSALLGKEGLFQTKISGKGIVLLELPVPEQEIRKYKLNNDTLKVDGNFAVLRSGEIEFTVEKSTKSLLGSASTGEGLINVFKGTGEVWLIPTKRVYDDLELLSNILFAPRVSK